MKQENIDKLIDVLETEYGLYKEMLKISKQKTDIIVEGKVGELDGVIKLEQSIVFQMPRIEKRREELLDNLSKETELTRKNWNVTEIKKHAGQAQIKRLDSYQSGMISTLEELQKVNELNSSLIQNSLEFIEFSINVMSNADVANNNYGKEGDSSKKEKKNFFDVRL